MRGGYIGIMSRNLIDDAILEGDVKAFQRINGHYMSWLSTMEPDQVLERYFGNPSRLSSDFYAWVRTNAIEEEFVA